MIELVNKKNNINFTKPIGGGKGEDGGYYIPSVDENGVLTWQATKSEMPEVQEAIIKGDSGVYVGSGDMPDNYNVQIDIDGEALNVNDELEFDENGDLANGDEIASVKCVNDSINFMADAFGEALENLVDKEYVDNLFNSIVNGNEVAF